MGAEGACLEGRLFGCLEGRLFGAEQVQGEDDLGDDGVGVGGVGGGRGGGGLPGAGDDRGALHEPDGAVGPRRLQVLRLLRHRRGVGGVPMIGFLTRISFCPVG